MFEFLVSTIFVEIKSLRQINSLEAEMYCLNSIKVTHAHPRHGRVKEYTHPNHGQADALYK